jgi:hypothetical protein
VPRCDPARLILPLNDSFIPPNAPALFGYSQTREPLAQLELRTEDGGVFPTTTEFVDGVTLLKLGAPLVAGAPYRIVGRAECIFDGGAPTTGESIVRGGAFSPPLPRTIGNMRIDYFTGRLGSIAQPDPSTTSKVAVAEIEIAPSAALEPYLSVTNLTTTIDGRPWGASEYGRGVKSREARRDVVTKYEFMRIFTVCGNILDSCAPFGTTPGRHEIQISAHVAGATVDPTPLTFSIDLQCEPDGGPPVPPDGGPTDPPDVLVTDVIRNPDILAPKPDAIDNPDVVVDPDPDAGSTPDATVQPDVTVQPDAMGPDRDGSTGPPPNFGDDRGCGCRIADRPPAGSAFGLLALAPAALAWAARRSRRSRRR